MARLGVLDAVLAILGVDPNSKVTLTDETINDTSGGRNGYLKAVFIQANVGAQEIGVEVQRDLGGDGGVPSVRGVFWRSMAGQGERTTERGIRSGYYYIRGGNSVDNQYLPQLRDFTAFVEDIAAMRWLQNAARAKALTPRTGG